MNVGQSASSGFLQRLERRLLGLPAADRAQVMAEIRGHIEDQRVRAGDDGAAAIAALGSPDALGDALLKARAPSLARRMMARYTAAARNLAVGVRLSTAGSLYLTALAFLAMAITKPIMPANVGLWLAPQHFTLGIVSSPGAPSTERLGFWLMPLAVLVATMIAGLGIMVSKARGWTHATPLLHSQSESQAPQ